MRDDLVWLQVAFTYHWMLETIGADGRLERSESEFVAGAFPAEQLRSFGFVDALGVLTEVFDDARDLALVELPERLTNGEKLGLLERLVEATAADGVLSPEECDTLAAAARTLGLSPGAWKEHVDGLLAGGRLRREA